MAPTVLIVDDDRTFLSFLSRTLKRGGFHVLEASDGSEVPEVLSSHDVDILLLDLLMPGVNGWEVLRSLNRVALEASVSAKRPKVVVVSARDEDDTVAFVRRLGAAAYLTKPLRGEQVLRTVRRVLMH